MKEITEKQFQEMLQQLSEDNWKVKGLIKAVGGYDNLNQTHKDLIDKELNIEREIIPSITKLYLVS